MEWCTGGTQRCSSVHEEVIYHLNPLKRMHCLEVEFLMHINHSIQGSLLSNILALMRECWCGWTYPGNHLPGKANGGSAPGCREDPPQPRDSGPEALLFLKNLEPRDRSISTPILSHSCLLNGRLWHDLHETSDLPVPNQNESRPARPADGDRRRTRATEVALTWCTEALSSGEGSTRAANAHLARAIRASSAIRPDTLEDNQGEDRATQVDRNEEERPSVAPQQQGLHGDAGVDARSLKRWGLLVFPHLAQYTSLESPLAPTLHKGAQIAEKHRPGVQSIWWGGLRRASRCRQGRTSGVPGGREFI
ncbi:hypothetical protein FA13DRAFT_1718715 [Coprinellus micaceus]|uniref:Uncharacterized protein n=1 Tax=Coprinellus micaceus TaxID=71717 RepID=A0A4Y7SDP1_COPMI|nr:hypothetical protein FA13DRAFT_1718715 [Coprinellus micaceus]